MTVQQVKQDLKNICYYHLHKALIDRAFACSANNKFLNTLQIYNNAIANAPSSQPQLCYIPDCGFEMKKVVGKIYIVCNFMPTCN